jgi:galactose-1-phosphate uridylyltransferase
MKFNLPSQLCPFCNVDRPLLAETDLSLAFFDAYPVSQGHTLIIPKRHIETIWEMTDEECADAIDLIRKVKGILKGKFDPHGFNLGRHERMAVKTLPGSPFEVVETKFLFHLLMRLLANPPCLDGNSQTAQIGRGKSVQAKEESRGRI